MSLSGTFGSTDPQPCRPPSGNSAQQLPISPEPSDHRHARDRGPVGPLSELSVTATIDGTCMTTATIRGTFTSIGAMKRYVRAGKTAKN
jgi:hypothetical protein